MDENVKNFPLRVQYFHSTFKCADPSVHSKIKGIKDLLDPLSDPCTTLGNLYSKSFVICFLEVLLTWLGTMAAQQLGELTANLLQKLWIQLPPQAEIAGSFYLLSLHSIIFHRYEMATPRSSSVP